VKVDQCQAVRSVVYMPSFTVECIDSMILIAEITDIRGILDFARPSTQISTTHHPDTSTMTAAASSSMAITVTYNLNPPTSINPTKVLSNNKQIPTSSTSLHPLNPASTSGSETSQHYAALGPALIESQRVLMESLSGWKDAIGDAEKAKEDPGTPGFGRGKAALMSEGVMDVGDEDSDEDEDEGEAEA
jgi:hypothetical protein